MNSKERVLAAFEKKAASRIPIHHIGFSSEAAGALLGREAYIGGGIQQWREAVSLWKGEEAHNEYLERSFQDAVDLALLLDEDIVRTSYWRYPLKPTKKIDGNTFLYAYGAEEDWTVLRYDPASEQCNVFRYKARDLSFEDIEKELEKRENTMQDYRPTEESFGFDIRAQRLLGDERIVRVGGVGIGIPIREADIWLEAFLLRPDLIERHLDLQVEQAKRNIEFLVPFGFRCFFGGGDFSSNTGPMYSPELFRELVAPRVKRISEECHKYGVYHLFASDGDLWPVAEDLFIAGGVDGYYEIDRRAGMDLGKLRYRFPELTLLGNISSHTVHLGTRADIVEETLSCIEEAKRSRGIVVGVSNYLVPGTPVENAIAMLDTIKRYR